MGGKIKFTCKKVRHESLDIKTFRIHVFMITSLYKLIEQRDGGI